MDNEEKRLVVYTYQLLEEITDGFSEERKIGSGSYGVVYKGVTETGEEIAVKMLHTVRLELDDTQFQNELRNLKKLEHNNIVQLVGYCYETHHKPIEYNGRTVFAEKTYRALCFEYMQNGSLQKYISDECDILDWPTCYKIIMGICNGLQYLHELPEPMYHLDLKPDNILLDMDMVPKLADFGLSKIVGEEQTRIMHSPVGTIGYLPMEYLLENRVSSKLDIFSLGVIMIKMIAGTAGRTKSTEMSHQAFINLVQEKWRDRLRPMWYKFDSSLDVYCQQVKKCAEIALRCLKADRRKRPNILDITNQLKAMGTELGSINKINQGPKREVLSVQPLQLRFPLEPNKLQLFSCSLHLTNNTSYFVAFRLRTRIPADHFVGPLYGTVPPRHKYTFFVTMRKQQKPLPYKHKHFVLESTITEDRTYDDAHCYVHCFTKAKENGHKLQQVKLTAVHVRTEPNITIISHASPNDYVVSIDVHPTESWIMTVHSGGSIRIWDYNSQEMVHSTDVETHGRVKTAKFIARAGWFVVGDHDGYMHVYSYDTMQKVKSFKAHYYMVSSLDIHPTEPYVLSASGDYLGHNLIKLWDWEKGWDCIRTFDVRGKVRQVKFHPKDSDKFAIVSERDYAQVWSIGSHLCKSTLSDETYGSTCFDFFDQGGRQSYLAVDFCHKAGIWNCDSATQVGILDGHIDLVTAVCSHPDLPILITGSNDGTVCLWNSLNFWTDGILNCGLGPVKAVACLNGSRRIAIGHQLGLAVTEIHHEKSDGDVNTSKSGNK